MGLWEKIGGRKFLAWFLIFAVYFYAIVRSYNIADWSFVTIFTVHFFVLTGAYIGVNVWQKKLLKQ